MIIGIVGLAVSVVASFFLWATLHELAHGYVFKSYYPDIKVTYTLYPHKHNDRWFWARVSWAASPLTPAQLAWVSIAPRLPDIIGAAATVLVVWLLGPMTWWVAIAGVLLGGSLVDLGVGSVGKHEESDLMRAARGWGWSPWLLRISGFALVGLFGALSVWALFFGF